MTFVTRVSKNVFRLSVIHKHVVSTKVPDLIQPLGAFPYVRRDKVNIFTRRDNERVNADTDLNLETGNTPLANTLNTILAKHTFIKNMDRISDILALLY